MFNFSEYTMLLESFKDAKRKWSQTESDTEHIDFIIQQFKELKDANFLSGQEKDISAWIPKPFSEFDDFVQDKMRLFKRKKELKQLEDEKSSDATKVFENDHCVVYNIHSYEASCKYGAGTKWCITSSSTSNYWHDYYSKHEMTFYFILSKEEPSSNPLYKIAVSVYPERYKEAFNREGINEIYDATDRYIDEEDFKDICEQDEIPLSIFVPREIITFKKRFEQLTTVEEQAKMLTQFWESTIDNPVKWNEDFTAAIIYDCADYEDFVDDYGNDTAKYCVSVFTGNDHIDVYEAYHTEECFDMLDHNKVRAYIEKEYPDEYDEDDQSLFAFLDERDDKLIDVCRTASYRGEEIGIENDMMDDFTKAFRDIEMVRDDGDELGIQPRLVGNYYDTPFRLSITFDEFKNLLLDDDNREDFENTGTVGYKIEVSQPHYGWSGFDEEAAKESLKEEAGDFI